MVRPRFSDFLLRLHFGDDDGFVGQIHAQRVDPAISAINQIERVGIRHSSTVAETAENIDGAHLFVHHVGSVHNEHISKRTGDLAGVFVFVFIICICAALQPGTRSPHGGRIPLSMNTKSKY